MEIDWVKFLTSEFKGAKSVSGRNGKELNIDCISEDCPNPKKHMFVNLGSQDPTHDKRFICQRCGIRGNYKAFLVAYFKMPLDDIIENFGDLYGIDGDPFYKAKNLVSIFKNSHFNLTNNIDKNDGFVIDLPECYRPLMIQNNFLKRRNIPLKLVKKFKFGICERGTYKDRIIIPIETKNNRAFIAYSQYGKKTLDYFKKKSKDNPKNKTFDKLKKKILNPFGAAFSSLLFNYNNIKKNEKIIFVHEGVTDVIRTIINGHQAVGIFKNVISKHQAMLLSEKEPREVCLMLDADVDKNTLATSYDILTEFCDALISVARLKKGDPDNISSKSDFNKVTASRKLLPFFSN
jgi:hypothetical protein